MLVKRHVADYYNGIFTVDDLDRILRQVIIYHNKYMGVEGNLSWAPTSSILVKHLVLTPLNGISIL